MLNSLVLAIRGKRKSIAISCKKKKGFSAHSSLHLPEDGEGRAGQAQVSVCSGSELIIPMTPQGMRRAERARLGSQVPEKWEGAMSVFEMLDWT